MGDVKALVVRSRAPLRLGLAGGGTDLSPFCDVHGGGVLNCTIDRYAYTFLEFNTSKKVRFFAKDLGKSEEHSFAGPLQIDAGMLLHRAVFNKFYADGLLADVHGVTLATSVDAPAGSGLGSSSALVVAMCEAFRFATRAPLGLYDVAHLAFVCERIDLALAGGKQDQYAAAFGGINFIEFFANDRVIVNPLRVERQIINELESSLVICFTGVSRDSSLIIEQQQSNVRSGNTAAIGAMLELKECAQQMKRALLAGKVAKMGEILAGSWASKKRTAAAVSSSSIERIFDAGLSAGAYAGKISGAGGGGFIMFLVAPEDRSQVISSLNAAGAQASPVHLTSRGVESWSIPA